MSEPLVLYVEASWTSPWVCSVFVALREKALPFSTAIAMMRIGTGAIDVMHDRSLTGTAPVLQHGSFWIAESLAIVEYLDEIFPDHSMLPANVRDRARARQLMIWMRQDHGALREARPAERIFYGWGTIAPLSGAARTCADELLRVADRLGADERGHIFERFGIEDVELAFALNRLISSGEPVSEALRAYVATVWARPSMREFIQHVRPPNPP